MTRAIRLPRDAKAEEVRAKFENGILEIDVPKVSTRLVNDSLLTQSSLHLLPIDLFCGSQPSSRCCMQSVTDPTCLIVCFSIRLVPSFSQQEQRGEKKEKGNVNIQ